MHKRRRFSFHKARAADWVRRGMRLPFILASVACSLAWADGGELPQKKPAGRKLGLSIQVQGGGRVAWATRIIWKGRILL